MKLYHVSIIPGIKVLEPRVSTHKKPYVYATKHLIVALICGGSKNNHGDFDGIYGGDKKPYFFENFENAFKERFEGQSCYVYEVDPKNFEEGKTSYSAEVVSEKPAKVLKCTKIDDLYVYLTKCAKEGKLALHKYENTKAYKKMIREHVFDRLVRFGVISNKNSSNYVFCKEKMPTICNPIFAWYDKKQKYVDEQVEKLLKI